MLSLATLKTKIQTEVPAFKLVTAFADLVAAKGKVTQTPAAYVYPASESAPPGDNFGRRLQRVTERFGVLIVVRNVSDATGAAAQQELKALYDALRDGLRGWQPGTEYDPVVLTSAGPAEMDNGLLYWPTQFQTVYELT